MREKYFKNFLSGLPPVAFSLRPRDLEKDRPRPKIHGGAVAAVTKSWLPAAARCARAHQRLPQLRHATAGPHESPAPTPHNHFLANPTSSALEAALEMHGALHWCLLEHSGARRTPAVVPPRPSGHVGPKMMILARVALGPNAPSSGLTVSYSLLTDYNRDLSSRWWMYQHVSITCECAVTDPFDAKGRPMEFTSLARYGGNKFYAVTLQGAVAVMEVFDTRLAITAVGSARAVPSSRSWRFFKEYLVEMKGEILIVYLIYHESVEVVDDVEVYRLDLDKLEWVRVERLKGKTVFLKESRYEWVESAEFRCRDSCVFFTQGKENEWRVYDMKRCCISSI